MKTLFLALALAAVAAFPARAHHEAAPYGLFWKNGMAASQVSGEVWRFAFVSKYTWKGCGLGNLH